MTVRRVLRAAAVVAALLAAGSPSVAAGPALDSPCGSTDPNCYGNQVPYGDAASAPPVRTAPAGYRLVFLETLGRHGSRSNTNASAETRALRIWTAAQAAGALTSVGAGFERDVERFQQDETAVGYGDLSTLGRQEWQGIGRRTADAYPAYFAAAAAAGEPVRMVDSGIHRTRQSADAMRAGLTAEVPGLTFAADRTDQRLRISEGSTKTGRAAIARIDGLAANVGAARHLLGTLYDPSYVATIKDPVGAALDVYRLYAIAAGMARDTSVTFADYVPRADAAVMSSLVDTSNFYRFGPGVSGQTGSYRQAEPVLEDFFTRMDQRLRGGSTAAYFRLGHGETTMPFAALLRLPGSERQAPRATPYSWDDNPWRGRVAGRMAGSIEWAVYADDAGHTLVTMRYAEEPVRFRASCAPTTPGGYFYRESTLKKCLR